MRTESLKVKTADGTADATLHVPDGAGPFPAVLFYMDALGYRPAMQQMAKRVAEAGYAVLVPDLFYRSQPFELFDPKAVWGDAEQRGKLMRIMQALTPALAMQDTAAYFDALKRPGVRADKVACMGYCMGGRLAFTAAGALPQRVAAAAVFHGGHLATDAPDSPHLEAKEIRAPLFFSVADNDRSCPVEQQATLEAALQAAGVRYQLAFNPGVAHGWCVPDSPAYDQAAAERHWTQLLGFFREALG